jgi:hypothetical protein
MGISNRFMWYADFAQSALGIPASANLASTAPASSKDLILDEPAPGAHKTCPYHKDIINLKPRGKACENLGLMERFMREGAEQSIMLNVGPGDTLNIDKDCTCGVANVSESKARL